MLMNLHYSIVQLQLTIQLRESRHMSCQFTVGLCKLSENFIDEFMSAIFIAYGAGAWWAMMRDC